MVVDTVTASVAPFIIVFREALEAGLVTTIMFAYLRKINRRDLYRWGYLGIVLSISASFVFGYILYAIYTGLAETFAYFFEVSASLLAVAVLSYMIVWMARNARKMKWEMEEKIDVAVTKGDFITISLAAFTTVGREGVETVLFLAPFIVNNLIGVLIGSLLGSISIIFLLYLLMKRIYQARLTSVFKCTSIFVAILAAGILYHATHELNTILEDHGLSLGFLSNEAYNLRISETSIFGEEGLIGGIIHSFTGYMQSAPWLSVVTYLGYWMIIGSVLYRTYQVNLTNE